MKIWKSPFLKIKVFSTNTFNNKYAIFLLVTFVLVILFLFSFVQKKLNPTANISHNSGIYSEPFELAIDYGRSSGQIRYTLNGEDPTIDSAQYTEPIKINETLVLKTALFNNQKVKSSVQIKSFIFKEHSLPVVSLITNPQNLWNSDTGIYTDGREEDPELANYNQRGDQWQKPAHIQLIDQDGISKLSENVEIRIFGGTTRRYEQKSFKVCAKEQLGSKNLEYDFFNNGDINHRCILLRNAGNDWRKTLLRDVLSHKIISETSLDTLNAQPSVVYLNGDYWGIYNIREFYDTDYLQKNYGTTQNSITLVEQSLENNSYPTLREGLPKSEEKYFELYVNLDNPQYLKQNIDLQNFTDFFIANIYLENSDYTDNNIRAWRFNTDVISPLDTPPLDGKWRWLPYDLDYSMGYIEENATFDYVSFNVDADYQKHPYYLDKILRGLLADQEYKIYFINRYSDLINTAFDVDKTLQTYKDLEVQYRPEIIDHTAKWGDESNITDIKIWNRNIDKIEDYLLNDAKRNSKTHLQKQFKLSRTFNVYVNPNPDEKGYLKINSINTKDHITKDTLEYFKNVPINVQAVPEFGYQFVGWTDESLGKDPNLQIMLKKDIELKPIFEPKFKGIL